MTGVGPSTFLRLQTLLCPCHAGVRGGGLVDIEASTANITNDINFGRAEMLRSLRNFLSRGRSNINQHREGEEKRI